MGNKTRYDQMQEAVESFHELHPEVWKLFDKFTRDRIELGFKNYSANAIFERIRWETDSGGKGDSEFKLNNNYRAFYAREWMNANPRHGDFFRLRKQVSQAKSKASGPELTPKDCPYEASI